MDIRFCLLGLVAVLMPFGEGVSAPLKTIEGHVLTLDVKVAGEQVMTPMVELVANAPALVEVPGAQPNEIYSLQLLLQDRQRVGKIDDAISVAAQLSGGDAKSQELLASPTLFIRPGKGGSATVGSDRGEVEISVLTHAVRSRIMSEAEYEKMRAGCEAKATPSLAAASVSAPNGEPPSCCSVGCSGGSGRLSCCGAIGCCACGVCCYPP